MDAAGNIYFAESDALGANLIRKISVGTGIVTTVAGSGTRPGFSGDNGPATTAVLKLNADSAVGNTAGNRGGNLLASDRAGNLYIADSGNNRIRKVTVSTGTIITVAGSGKASYSGDGGAATAASLHCPCGVAVDSDTNLYVADSLNHRVRKVDGKTGIITTIAGQTIRGFYGDGGPANKAMLADPMGIAVDSSGNVYFADQGNNRVFRIGADDRILTTIAGNGISGDGGNGAIATRARLASPFAIALDGAGNLFIAERAVVHIAPGVFVPEGATHTRRVDGATKIITTVPVIGDAMGLATDTAGNLFASGITNGIGYISLVPAAAAARRTAKAPIDAAVALRFSMTPGVMTVVAGTLTVRGNLSGSPDGDGGIATSAITAASAVAVANASGDLYIADMESHSIRKIAADTGIITTVAGNGTPGYGGDGGSATKAQLNRPSNVTFDGVGNMYIADTANHRIRMVNTKGVISTVAGDGIPAPTAAVYSPQYIAADARGTIYFTNLLQNRVLKVAAGSKTVTPVSGIAFSAGYNGDNGPAIAAKLNAPAGLAVDTSGNLYIADSGNQRIRKVDTSTGIITTVASGAGPALAVDTAGNLYISGNDARIREKDSATGMITVLRVREFSDDIGDTGTEISTALPNISGLAVDQKGNLYLASGVVYKIVGHGQ